jgi:hypothetical protein
MNIFIACNRYYSRFEFEILIRSAYMILNNINSLNIDDLELKLTSIQHFILRKIIC